MDLDSYVERELPVILKQDFLSTQDHLSNESNVPPFFQSHGSGSKPTKPAQESFRGYDSLNDRVLAASLNKHDSSQAVSNHGDSINSNM